jgi:hypothetical protein
MTPVKHLEPLSPLIGRWRTSGSILSEDGSVTGEIKGSDVYRWLPGSHWVVHEVDVLMGEERTQALELIGGRDERSGGWQMLAFDTADSPGRMSLTLEEPGLLLLQGDGVRSWMRPEAGPDLMTALWEQLKDGNWVPWLEMRFERESAQN